MFGGRDTLDSAQTLVNILKLCKYREVRLIISHFEAFISNLFLSFLIKRLFCSLKTL